MKKILIAFILVGLMTSCGSAIVPVDEKLEQVMMVDKTGNELFEIANDWAVEHFVNADAVIQYSDKESGVIKGKYTIQSRQYYGYGIWSQEINAVITIKTKDGALKITVNPNVSSVKASLASKIDTSINNVVKKLNEAINAEQDDF